MMDHTGKNYSSAAYKPLGDIGSLWQSTELVGSHSIFTSTENRTWNGDSVKTSVIEYGTLHLNHSISSNAMTPTIDGEVYDWRGNDEAIFIGSKSQAQASIRVTADSENMYVLIERLDEYIANTGDRVALRFAGKNKSESYSLTVGRQGIVALRDPSDNVITLPAGCVAKKVYGTVGDHSDKDTGFVVEVKIPFSYIGGSANSFLVQPLLQNLDDSTTSADKDLYTLSGMSKDDMSTWIKVSVK